MTVITTTEHIILDSSGQPANGRILFTQSARGIVDGDLVTTTPGTVTVKDGRIAMPRLFDLPATGDGEGVLVVEMFRNRGEETRKVTFWVEVPDVASVEYADLPQITSPTAGPGVPSWAAELIAAIDDLNTVNDPIVAGLVEDEGTETGAALRATIAQVAAAHLTVNVKDYGATGEGVVDDRAAIQAALDAAGPGGTIYFPPGTYHLASMTITADRILKVYPGQSLTGQARNAVTLYITDTIGPYKTVFGLAADATNPVTFSMWGITVDQNCDGGNAYVAADVNTAPRNILRALSYTAGSVISVQQCAFLNASGLNTVYVGADTIDISDNLFLGTGPAGVTTWYDHSTLYTTVTVDGGTQSIRGNTFRGKLGSGGATCAIETHGGAQVVTDNNVSGYQIGANLTGWAATIRVESILFAENAISRCVYGVQVWSRYAGTITTGFACQGVKILDNNITLDRDAWQGITGLAITSWGITVEEGSTAPVSGIEISRNTIRFLPTALTTVANDARSVGIRLTVASTAAILSDVDITDNTIINALSSGMTFSAVIHRLRVARNTVVDPAQSGHASVASIYLSFASITGTLVDADFDQNVLVDTRSIHKCLYMFICQSGMTSGVDVKSRRNKVRFTDAANPPVTFYPSSAAGTAPFIDDETTVWPGVFQPAKAGSRIKETSTGRVYVQAATPSGTTWKTSAELGMTVGTTAPSAGAAGALPATPAGYVTKSINGTDRQIPYY